VGRSAGPDRRNSSAADVVGVLQRLGLLDAERVVTRGRVARDMSGRHRLDLVEGAVWAAVKEPGREGPPHALERERKVLAWLADGRPKAGPRVIAWDPEKQVLATEFLPGETPAVMIRRLGELPPAVAARLGATLAGVHLAPTPPHLTAEVPDALLHQHRPTPAALAHRTRGQLALARAVQRAPTACAALDAVARGWRAIALIHGDIRWGNVIVHTAPQSGEVVVRLVDWECAGCGDPSWDVGSATASMILDRLDAPAGAPLAARDLVDLANRALEGAQPAVAALWGAWTERMGLAGAPEADAAQRATRFAGARLLQLAHEGAGEFDSLPLVSALAAQVGVDLLTRPGEAAGVLLRPVPGLVSISP
jgi:aminoglycoside phosphotransferase (APT) family kinase protein